MFSGKTEELIRRVERAELAGLKVSVFKPEIDDRYAADFVVSHASRRREARVLRSPLQLLEQPHPPVDMVVLDEVQFFPEQIIPVLEQLANSGVRVLAVGLDLDYRGVPFEVTASLMARAERVSKLHAVCLRCGGAAYRSLRLTDSESRIQVGASLQYEAVCRRCYVQARTSIAGDDPVMETKDTP